MSYKHVSYKIKKIFKRNILCVYNFTCNNINNILGNKMNFFFNMFYVYLKHSYKIYNKYKRFTNQSIN